MSRNRCLAIVGIVVAVAVLFSVLFCVVLVNHRPVIYGLGANPEKVIPLGSCQVTCNATDPDGDQLSYGWSATGGTISGRGPTIIWTAPKAEGSFNLTVIVMDSRGGAVSDHVIVMVRANRPPAISDLVADAEWTLPSGSVDLICEASDPNDDELTYEWSASGGDISGTGEEVVWSAPQEIGVYYITVVVMDDHGSSDMRTLSLAVASEEPPDIEELNISKDRYGHCYLKKYSGGYYVGQGQMYDIECVVSDTSIELSYEWSCTGGVLSGEGSIVAWTAPDTSGKLTITAVVSDIAGNTASKDLVLTVASCSTCTFGSCST